MRLWLAIGTLMIVIGAAGCAAHTQRQASTLGPRADGADRKLAETCNENGLACVQRGEWKEAERWFRTAMANDPHYVAARNNLGLVMLQRGAVKQAQQQLLLAHEFDPLATAPRNNLRLANTALIESPVRNAVSEKFIKTTANSRMTR